MTMRYILITLFAVSAWGATYTAASCSLAAVQAAYATEQANKADGDIIAIPSCASTTWSAAWTISPTNSLTFQGNTTVVGNCLTSAACVVTDNTIIADGVAGTAWNITTAAGKSFRITGLTFNQSSGTPAYGAITIQGSSTSVRVDHNHFNDTTDGGHTFNVDGINGVLDHNFFDSTNQANSFAIQITDGGASGWGHESWTQADNFGTSQFLYVENNWFRNIAFMYDCDTGGRVAVRYNGVGFNTRIQTHGLTNKSTRGCRTQELYQNTFTFSSSPDTNSFAFLMMLESGSGLFWGNTLTAFVKMVDVDMKRTGGESQTATPNGWGICGSSPVGGVPGPSNWDGNVGGQSGAPCIDSVGRGAGDLLSGCFAFSGGPCTQVTNTRTGGIAWPQQALVPVYAWANTINPNSYAPTSYWTSQTQVVENRDYYLQLPNIDEPSTFNGSAGIGAGTLLPTNASAYTNAPNCTTGVAYWDTTNQTLYQCSATNTWSTYYTPYTYPHPLTQGAPVITTISPLPSGIVGTPYSLTLSATGTAPLTWSATGLPAWASFDTNTGILSGTPTVAATSAMNFSVSNAYGSYGPKTINLTINPQPPMITTVTLPAGTVGVAYSTTLTATGGTPFTWSASGLPSWATLNSSTGVLSGTPDAAGVSALRITVTNDWGTAGPRAFSLAVAPAPVSQICIPH